MCSPYLRGNEVMKKSAERILLTDALFSMLLKSRNFLEN